MSKNPERQTERSGTRSPEDVVAAVKKENVLGLGRGPQANTHSGALRWAFWEGFRAAERAVREKADGPATSGSTRAAKAILRINQELEASWRETAAK